MLDLASCFIKSVGITIVVYEQFDLLGLNIHCIGKNVNHKLASELCCRIKRVIKSFPLANVFHIMFKVFFGQIYSSSKKPSWFISQVCLKAHSSLQKNSAEWFCSKISQLRMRRISPFAHSHASSNACFIKGQS